MDKFGFEPVPLKVGDPCDVLPHADSAVRKKVLAACDDLDTSRMVFQSDTMVLQAI